MQKKSIYFQKIKNKVIYAKLYRNNYNPKFFDNFKEVKDVIYSGKWSSSPYPGKYNKKFVDSFLKVQKAKYGLCLSNGTVAISVALKASGLKFGDEVLMSSLTYHTTASAALEIGIKPKFIDINPDTLCIDIKLLEKNINRKTKAVIIVHLGSMVSNIEQISKICKKKKIILIEDCSHVHGALWNGKGVGTFGDFGSFSFQQSKLITSGEGGFLIIKDKRKYKECLSLVNCGRDFISPFKTLGVNHRLSEIQCALLLYKLKKFKKNLNNINSNINYFTNEISKFDEFQILKFDNKYKFKTGYFYGFKLNKSFLKRFKKDIFTKECEKLNINIQSKLYSPVYLNPEFGWKNSPIKINYKGLKCPNAESVPDKEVVWLNFIHFTGNKYFINQIINSFKLIFKKLNNLR